MDKFVINTKNEKPVSINRTIRLKPDYFNSLMTISKLNGISFNKLVNQCIEYALDNYEAKWF